MAVIKFTNSKGSLKRIINYITQEEKTDAKLISGQNCMPESAFDEMSAVKNLYSKNNGRQYIHIVQSFKPDENLTHEKAHEIGVRLAEYFRDYQVVIATHKDRDHIHNHLVLNSVSMKDGRKFQQSAEDMRKFKDFSDRLCKEFGLSVIDKNKQESIYSKNEYQAAVKGESYKFRLINAIDKSIAKSANKAEFINNMRSLGYGVVWTADRKHITYTTPEGTKHRDNKLHDTKYLKENMEAYFNEYARYEEKERNRGSDGETVYSQYHGDTPSTVGNISRSSSNDRFEHRNFIRKDAGTDKNGRRFEEWNSDCDTEFAGKENKRYAGRSQKTGYKGHSHGGTWKPGNGSNDNQEYSERNFGRSQEHTIYGRNNQSEVFFNRSNDNVSLVNITSHISAIVRQPKQLRGKKFHRKSDSKQVQKERAIAMADGSTFEYEDGYDDELEM